MYQYAFKFWVPTVAAILLSSWAGASLAAPLQDVKPPAKAESNLLRSALKAMFPSVDSIEWKVEGGKDERSTVTCKKSSSGYCFVLVGKAGTPSATAYVVPAGQAMAVRNVGREMSYCIETADRKDWPQCLGSKANQLKYSSSGTFVASTPKPTRVAPTSPTSSGAIGSSTSATAGAGTEGGTVPNDSEQNGAASGSPAPAAPASPGAERPPSPTRTTPPETIKPTETITPP